MLCFASGVRLLKPCRRAAASSGVRVHMSAQNSGSSRVGIAQTKSMLVKAAAKIDIQSVRQVVQWGSLLAVCMAVLQAEFLRALRFGSRPQLALVSPPVVPLAFISRLQLLVGFWLSEFLMWSPIAKVTALLVLCVVVAYLGASLFKMVDPKLDEVDAPLWRSIRAIVNPFEDDFAQPKTRIVSSALAITGTIFFGILVGMVTSTVEETVNALPNTTVPVLVSDHVVVAGWNSNLPLALSNVAGSGIRKVAVVTSRNCEDVVSDLRERLGSSTGGRVYVRAGSPMLRRDMDRVRAMDAKTLLIVPDKTYRRDPDAKDVISKALAIRSNLTNFKGDIVAVVNDSEDADIVKKILGETQAHSVQVINVEQLQGRFLAQAALQPGLFKIVSTMLDSESNARYYFADVKTAAPHLAGKSLKEVNKYTSVPGSTLVGHSEDGSSVHLSVNDEHILLPSSKLLLLGNNTGTMKSTTVSVKNTRVRSLRDVQNVLICGWRNDMVDMLRELDSAMPSKSKVTVIANSQLGSLPRKLANSSVEVINGRWDNYDNLGRAFSRSAINKVIILAPNRTNMQDGDTELDLDAESLAGIAYIEKHLERTRKGSAELDLSVEFWDERMGEITENYNLANVMFPSELASRLIAEAARDPLLNVVWEEILSQYGREVTIKRASTYLGNRTRASYEEVASEACREDEVAIGYIIDNKNKAIINPQGDEFAALRTWDDADKVIVLSIN
mmetsp:Transcript_9244/g.27824  ORF Transcript_9244/g.27824 Transcript_9244/m.27824 type:complete len:729 (+) Transcript_9244:103-2289(+)